MERRTFLVGLFFLAFSVRLGTGALSLAAGPTEFVLRSDDGDAYDAAAQAQAFDVPIVMTDRLARKWHLATGDAAKAADAAGGDAGAGGAAGGADAAGAAGGSGGAADVLARWPAGYWLFLEAQYRLLGSAYVSTVVLQALLGAGGVLAGFALASRLLPATAARLAGVAQAVSAPAVYLSAGLFAESLYLPLLLGGLALVASVDDRQVESGGGERAGQHWPGWVLPALGGALFGLAEVTRPLALAVFAVALTWTMLVGRRGAAVALCLGFALAIGPFLAYDLAATGRPTLFTAGGGEAFRDAAALSQPLAERVVTLFVTGGWAPMGELPVGGAGLTVLTRLVEWALILAGGIWLLRPARRTATTWLVAGAALAIVGPALLVGLPLVRYRAPADPLFIIWMAAAVMRLASQTRSARTLATRWRAARLYRL